MAVVHVNKNQFEEGEDTISVLLDEHIIHRLIQDRFGGTLDELFITQLSSDIGEALTKDAQKHLAANRE